MEPTTVGTSSSEKRISEPNASASTERSIILTEANVSYLSAINFIPFACRASFEVNSLTLIFIKLTHGNDKIGIAFFLVSNLTFSSQLYIFIIFASVYIASPKQILRATSAALAPSGV